MRFSDDFLTELRARTDIEELIGKYTEIRHRGSRTPVALCPFHTEKTPSFVIYRDSQSYYCFGCGAGGDAINFVRNIERLDYTEAVRFLCEKAGMAMPTDPVDDEYNRLRRRCYEANRLAARFFYRNLSSAEGQIARDYIAKRGLTKETVTHFGLGFAPDSWDSLVKFMKSKGFHEEELITFDLAKRTRNGGVIDNFRNRFMFPIIDLRGNVMAFGGRVFDDSKPKYLNTGDTPVFKKGQGIYALNFAKNNTGRKLILCEGYMDVISMHQAGFTEAVAALGTAFTREQVSLLARYCDELTLSFDSDEAGRKATARALRMLESSPMKIKIMQIDGGKDPDEIIKTQGKQTMSGIISTALNHTEYALKLAAEKYDVKTESGKLMYLNEAVSVLAGVYNAIERDIYITRLANELQVSRDSINSQVEKEAKKQKRQLNRDAFLSDAEKAFGLDKAVAHNPEKRAHLRAATAEERLLATLLKHPDYYRRLSGRLSEDLFITEINRRLYGDIVRRIEENRNLDLSLFGENHENEEIAYLSYLISLGERLSNSIEESEDCIGILLEEKARLQIKDVGQMSDEEFIALLQKKRT